MQWVRTAAATALLCATATAVAAPAQDAAAIEPDQERVALRAVLGLGATSAGSGLVPLPLNDPARPQGARAALARNAGRGRLIVGARTHEALPGLAERLERLGARVQRLELLGALALAPGRPARAQAALATDRRIAYVERDTSVKVTADGDRVDPETGIPFTWANDAVRAPGALLAAGGGSTRKVAVVDSGIDAGHPDLAGRVARTIDGRTGGPDAGDTLGHGTFVAGLVAAVDGNGLPARGAGGGTQLVAVRVTSEAELAVSELVRGITTAVRARSNIINISLTGQGLGSTQERALRLAFFNNVLPVASAGNNGDKANPLEFPAAAIGGRRGGRGIGLSVGALKPDGAPAGFSSHNAYVSLAAPGADQAGCEHGVFSTLPRGGASLWDSAGSCSRRYVTGDGSRFAYGEGTSFAAPLVSGLAALVWKVEPALQSDQVAHVLTRSARQTVGGRWNEFTGAGIADGEAAAALARRYDTTAPRARGSARRRGRSVRARVGRSGDRTRAGRERSGRVRYSLLRSTDNGRSYRFVVRPRSRPFSKTVGLRGRRTNVFVASVCDRNGNCGRKRLGRYRPR